MAPRRSVTRSTSTSTCRGGATRASTSASREPPSGKAGVHCDARLRERRAQEEHADPGAGRGARGAVALKPLGRDFYRRDARERRARPAQQGAGPRDPPRPHRRGRGLPRRRRSGEPRVPRADRAQRHDVRPARPPVRVLHLRHALVRERRVRRRGRRHRGAAACARARSRASTRCGPPAAASARTPRSAAARRSSARRSASTVATTASTSPSPRRPRPGSATTARSPPLDPGQSTRIGISVAVDHPWRWYVAGDPNLSRRG